MTRLVDLDDIAGLETAIAELQRIHDLRDVDPELRADIERVIDEGVAAGRISAGEGDHLRRELDEVVPAAMLVANFEDLVPNRPTIANYRKAFPRRKNNAMPAPTEWLAADPERLRGVMVEMSRFTDDVERVVAGAYDVAASAGISVDIAKPIIVAALRELPKRSSHVG